MQNGRFDRSARSVFERFRADAARWVVPEGFTDPAGVDALQILRLLRRHRQLRAMFWFRLGEWGFGAPGVRGLVWFADQRMQGGYGLDFAPSVEVDGGLYIAHPSGCAVNATRIGSGVTIVAAVTIGVRGDDRAPIIGDRAFIGAGARVIGPIEVGTEARVGANAVVLDDVPPRVTVVGIPARQIERNEDADPSRRG